MFSVFSFAILFFLNMAQGVLPLNPENIDGTSWHLAFNTTSSFVTNTNWQSYSGESALSYFTQMLGLTVQNFVSAGVGIVVLFALIRGFTREKGTGIGTVSYTHLCGKDVAGGCAYDLRYADNGRRGAGGKGKGR